MSSLFNMRAARRMCSFSNVGRVSEITPEHQHTLLFNTHMRSNMVLWFLVRASCLNRYLNVEGA